MTATFPSRHDGHDRTPMVYDPGPAHEDGIYEAEPVEQEVISPRATRYAPGSRQQQAETIRRSYHLGRRPPALPPSDMIPVAPQPPFPGRPGPHMPPGYGDGYDDADDPDELYDVRPASRRRTRPRIYGFFFQDEQGGVQFGGYLSRQALFLVFIIFIITSYAIGKLPWLLEILKFVVF